MLVTGAHKIPASPERVWEALHDPDVLKQSIPRCQDVVRESETQFRATVGVKLGALAATFSGRAEITERDPPHHCRITGEGSGGAAGFANATASVTLESADDGTRLGYEVEVSVGGKLAQIGSGLVEATARKIADDFFAAFAKHLGAAEVSGARSDEDTETVSSAPAGGGLGAWI